MENQHKIPAANLPRLQARIAEIAKRAAKIAKRGSLADDSPIGLKIGDKIVEKVKDDLTGLPEVRVYFMVEVTGTAPRLSGWEFVATLQHEDGGTILRSVPTVALDPSALAGYRNAEPACDHCRVNRRRNDTFVVRRVENGALKQIGRSCLGDFLGHQDPAWAARRAEFLVLARDAVEESMGWGGGGEYVEDIAAYLAYVACAIQREGWLSRTKAREMDGRPATADLAWNWMHPSKNTHPADRVYPEEQHVEAANKALAWADAHLSSAVEGSLTDYEHNLRVAIIGGTVRHRLAGIVASILPYHERAMGRELSKAKWAEDKDRARAAGHVGVVGKREVFELALVKIFDFDGNFGVTHVHKFVADNGAVVVWKTGTERLEIGRYRVKGTVKKHDEYKGEPQTLLSRCVVDRLDPAGAGSGSCCPPGIVCVRCASEVK